MSTPRQNQKQGRARRLFRAFRISSLLLILGAVLLLGWFNLVGLPQFVRARITQTLSQAGLHFDARSVRLRGFSALSLRQAQLTLISDYQEGVLDAKRAYIDIALRHWRDPAAALRRITLTQGNLKLQLKTNQHSGDTLTLTNISADLLVPSSNLWELDVRQAESSLGPKIIFSGRITNAINSLQQIKPSKPKKNLLELNKSISKIVQIIEAFEFSAPPQLIIRFATDALHPEHTQAEVKVEGGPMNSPWGGVQAIEATVNLNSATDSFRAVLDANLRAAQTPWGHFDSLTVAGNGTVPLAASGRFHADWSAALWNYGHTNAAFAEGRLQGRTDQAGRDDFNSAVTGAFTGAKVRDIASRSVVLSSRLRHPSPFQGLASVWQQSSGSFDLGFNESVFSRGSLNALALQGQFAPSGAHAGTNWGFWTALAPQTIDLKADAKELRVDDLQIDSVSTALAWRANEVKIDSFDVLLYGGPLTLTGLVDVGSRQAHFDGRGKFDYHRIQPLLEPEARRWLAQFSWSTPPDVEAKVSFQLPPWSGTWTNLAARLLPTLQISGQLAGAGAFRGVPVDWARSRFEFTNFVWHLPDLEVNRPEGHASLAYRGNVETGEFRCYLNSHINPLALKPLLEEDQQEALSLLSFHEPPEIEGELWGDYDDPSTIGFEGKIRLRDFVLKGEPILDLTGDVTYTNATIICRNLLGHRTPQEQVQAPWLKVDFKQRWIDVTNVLSTVNPYIAMGIVGKKIRRQIEPYHFATPPTVRVNGRVPMDDPPDVADLHFNVSGENFSYWKFNFPQATGNLYWKDDDLTLTNVVVAFYQGEGRMTARFHFNDDDTADFRFRADIQRADLKALMNDLIGTTNRMEGKLDGRLVVTSANSDDWKSWNGYGTARLKDGYLWSVPVFGIFTPVLDSLSPGLGVSRLTAGTATFRMTNSVIHTRDLEVRAPAFRLKYDGKVDFEGNLDAQMEALLLRDTWFVGPALRWTLWPVSKVFEAKIGGSLNQPKSRLRHFPRWVTAPFRPFSAASELLKGKPKDEGKKPPKEETPLP